MMINNQQNPALLRLKKCKCSESIAHEAERAEFHWLRGQEGERDNCFSKIQLVGQKYRDKTTLAS